jgi:hypothetical protein
MKPDYSVNSLAICAKCSHLYSRTRKNEKGIFLRTKPCVHGKCSNRLMPAQFLEGSIDRS